MRQYGPWPSGLEVLVAQARHRRGGRFSLEDVERDPADTHGASAGGLTLVITTLTPNSRHEHACETCRSSVADYRVAFSYPVPAATYDRQTWLDWLMDRVEETELHEAREFFRLERTVVPSVEPGMPIPAVHQTVVERPFAPNHGPGRDPGRRYSYADDEHRRTSFRGEVVST